MKKYRRTVICFLTMIMLVLQVGCGTGANQDSTDTGSESKSASGDIIVEEVSNPDMVYTTKEALILAQAWDLMEAKLSDDMLCFASSQSITRNALSGGKVETLALQWEDAPAHWYSNQICFGTDGSIYSYMGVIAENGEDYYLGKFGTDGKLLYACGINDFIAEVSEEWDSNWDMEVDGDGRLYMAASTKVGLFAADGTSEGMLSIDNSGVKITDIARARDGKIYVAYVNEATGMSYIGEVDFAQRKVTNTRKAPQISGMSQGMEKDLLVYSEETVYEYDVAGGKMLPLFAWGDCNVNGQNVQRMDVLTDGRLVVLSGDYISCSVDLIKRMTKEEAAAATTEPTEITIGILSDAGKALGEAVVRFNKESDKYKVVIKDYRNQSGEISGMDLLNSHIVAGNGPDILEISNLDVNNFAEKGLFENLYDYLDKSDVLSRDVFIDRLLELYTRDGKLVGIPHSFTMNTCMGSSEHVGEEMGWTLAEMLDMVSRYPDKQILHNVTKLNMLNVCIRFNESAFIDWDTGECKFDSEEFIDLIKLVNSFPENSGSGAGKPSAVTRVGNGEVLLAELYMKDFFSLQPYSRILASGYTCVGYPNGEGIGCECIPEDVMAISTQSKNKEGAWEFLEYFYQYRSDRTRMFPCLKEMLEADAEESKVKEELFLGTYTYPDGVTYKEQNPTQEEIDITYQLIDGMQLTDMNIEVFFIIKEETAAYFNGQKSVEEVAEIIQNRIQNYVDENK